MNSDALQHIHPIRVKIDLVQATGHDQALHDTDVFCALLSPGRDAGGADRIKLGFVDRFEQGYPLLAQRREPRSANRDAGVGEPLVLTIERQVVGKLIDQQTGDEADVGTAAVNDAQRCGCADESRWMTSPSLN